MSVEAITWALKQKAGDPCAKVVLFCLANYADEEGKCWPSQSIIAEQTEQSVDTVQRRLKVLEERGLLKRYRRQRDAGGWTSDLIVLAMFPTLPQPAVPPIAAPLRAAPQSAVPPVAAGDAALVRHHESLIEPSTTTPSPVDLNSLEKVLLDAGGDALSSHANGVGLRVLSVPLSWIANGCDLDADIVPTIRARSAGRKPNSIRTWSFFSEAVYEARDRRIAVAPSIQAPMPSRRNDPYRSRVSDEELLAASREIDAEDDHK